MSTHGKYACYTNGGCRCGLCRAANSRYHRERRARLRAANPLPTCPACVSRDVCDDHQVPPVCVCTDPEPDVWGQCRRCLLLYKPHVAGFTECRTAWQQQLENARG